MQISKSKTVRYFVELDEDQRALIASGLQTVTGQNTNGLKELTESERKMLNDLRTLLVNAR